MKRSSPVSLAAAAAILVLLALSGCNRAMFRLPMWSGPFPETPTGYATKRVRSAELSVLLPTDLRKEHYGEKVAGTKWKACRTDGLRGDAALKIIQDRLALELNRSGLYKNVRTGGDASAPLVLKTEIDAFCSQARGFVLIPWTRVAGITSLHFTLVDSGKVVFDEKLERVVTDADKEYTGTGVGTIGEAMHVTMADSLRGVIAQLLRDLDERAPADNPR